MPDFGSSSEEYRSQVQESVSFARGDLEYITWVKADHILRAASSIVGALGQADALDVGCGAGALAGLLHPSFRSFTGVDSSVDLIAAAKASVGDPDEGSPASARLTSRPRFVASDGASLPFDTETFDVTFTVNVLHHVPPEQRAGFVAEMARVTRPGGVVLAIEQNPWNPLTRLAVDRCPFDADAQLLSSSALRRLLSSPQGMEEAGFRYILFSPWSLSIVSAALERALWWLPAGAQHLAAVRKPAH